MPTVVELALVLVAHPGALPAPARDLVIDAAIAPQSASHGGLLSLAEAALARPDIPAADARRIWGRLANPDVGVLAAWLARPEHDLTQLPDLTLREAARDVPGQETLDTLVALLLHQPLCRPEVRGVLCGASPQLATAVRHSDSEKPSTVTVSYTPTTARVRRASITELATRIHPWRAVAAEHLVTTLGDNPDSWRVLRATVGHLIADTSLAAAVTVASGVAHTPATDAP